MDDKLKTTPPAPVSVEKKKKPAAPLLPVSYLDKKKKVSQFPAVQLVCMFALLTACIFAGNDVYNHVDHQKPCPSKPSRLVSCYELTDAQALEAAALHLGQLWCSAPQAAAAVLALLLRRRRRAFAFVAVAATAANHYLYARLVGVRFVATPAPGGNDLVGETVLVFVLGLFDLLGFLALLLYEE